MSEPEKGVWTRRHPLPNLAGWIWPLIRPRMLLRYFFCLACVATLIALFYAEEDLRGKLEWNSYMRQSQAGGLELDWRAYVPPPVPDGRNFAMTPPFEGFFDYEDTPTNNHWRDTNIWQRIQRDTLHSESKEPPLGAWVQGHPLDLKAWQLFFRSVDDEPKNLRASAAHDTSSPSYWPVPNQPQTPAEDVLLGLSKFDSDLAALRQASARPESRFPIHYEEIAKAFVVHLSFLSNLSQILQLRAVAELEAGRAQEAFEDIRLAFYLAGAIKTEPFLISQHLRCGMMEGDLQPIWEGLSAHRWSDDQIQALQQLLAKNDLLSQFEMAVHAELAFTCGWIESLADDPSTFDLNNEPPVFTGFQDAMFHELLPRGWCYQNELSAARFFREDCLADVAAPARRAYPEQSRRNEERFDQLPSTSYTFAFKHLGGAVSPQRFVRLQTEINLAQVACALERYHLAHGRYPQSLAALAPEFQPPPDIINGEPLKYGLTSGGGFALYSVGWNEKDDGGAYPGPDPHGNRSYRELAKYSPETGDWVWEYPPNTP
jgi:hypothetical protein